MPLTAIQFVGKDLPKDVGQCLHRRWAHAFSLAILARVAA